MTLRSSLVLLGSLLVASVASAAPATLDLSRYSLTGAYNLDVLGGTSGSVSGLEASAVTYARDRGSLFFVGDEGTGVVEMSLTGQTLGTMAFDWAGTGSTKHDTEGLTYLGAGVLVVSEERLYDAYRFNYASGGTATLANAGVSISSANVGNDGLEGISYDARNGGSFVSVKQQSPQDLLAGSLTFSTGVSGTSAMSQLFDPALLGVSTLSDVQTLAAVDSLAGTAGADNLLVLSLGSQKLLEVTRSGTVLGSLDLSTFSPNNAIEGVTVDEHGVIYLVAEQQQSGTIVGTAQSKLFVLSPTAAVPEPETYALFLAGLAVVGAVRRSTASRPWRSGVQPT